MCSSFFSLASRTSSDGGWPEGGSLAMAQRMAQRFEQLGGQLHVGARVERIIVEKGKAAGIKLEKQDATIPADYIVPAVDADVLFRLLLEGKYRDEYFEQRYAAPGRYPLLAATLLNFGVDTDLSGYPHSLYVETGQPLRINIRLSMLLR